MPAGERFDWYADSIAREVMPAAPSGERPAAFQGEAAVLDPGHLRVSHFALRRCIRGAPPPALIRRGDPEHLGRPELGAHRVQSIAARQPFGACGLTGKTLRPRLLP